MTTFTPSFPLDDTPIGVYIHVPFCRSRCHYCGFVTNPHDSDLEEPYVRAVIQEIQLWSERIARGEFSINSEVDTLYFGGGTPSLLEPERVLRIVEAVRKCFRVVESPEITLEINPATADRTALRRLRNAGVNRASLGIQSLHDAELRAMSRPHTVQDALDAFDDLRDAGFENVSVDLIAGFPGQTREFVARSVREALSLEPEHLSVYLLEVKPGTILAANIQAQTVPEPDEDLIADLYEDICSAAAGRGYEQYEIANFCLPGHASLHNLKYWQDRVFLGVGAAAHGMTGRHRYANTGDLHEYEQAVSQPLLPCAHMQELTPETRFKDALIMGLRLVKGLDLDVLGCAYRVDARAYVEETIGDLSEAGLFVIQGSTLRLTDRGRLLSNVVFARWV